MLWAGIGIDPELRSSRKWGTCYFSVQSFSIPVGSFTIHPWIRTRQLCTARKGDSSVFCTKKEGYLGVCQATERVDSTGERLYWRRDPQLSNCLQRPPVQDKKACTRPYSTPLHTANFPMQYRNDIRILDRGAPLHAPCIGLHCAHNAPDCHPTAPTLLRHRVRAGLSGAGWGHVVLAGHPTIKKRNAAPTNGDLSPFPCGLS